MTDDSSGTVSCSISGTGTLYVSYQLYNDLSELVDEGSPDGSFSINVWDYYAGGGTLYVDAYCEAYGITSDTASDSIWVMPA